MARYPDAEWLPLPENSTEPSINPTQIILHSAVSNASSLRPYFGRSDVVVESHFYVRRDGTVEQYIDTDRQADANYQANGRAISIESWDGGDPDRTPWNPAQVASLVALVRWCCATYGIPIRHAPAWDAPGIGGHSDYAQWSNVRGKTCPGLARRPQVPQIIAAVAGSTTSGSRIPDITEDDMYDDADRAVAADTQVKANSAWVAAAAALNEVRALAARVNTAEQTADAVWAREGGHADFGPARAIDLLAVGGFHAREAATSATVAAAQATASNDPNRLADAVRTALATVAPTVDVDEGALAAEIIRQLATKES